MADPFFIVGCGRSGTTYLRSLLIRHPHIGIPLESLFMVDYLRVADRFPVDFLLDLMVDEPEIAEWGLHITRRDLAGCSDIVSAIHRLHELYIAQHGKQVWGQKTPRLVRHLDLLHAAFPNARMIHLVRDPRAVVRSLIQSDVHRSTAYHGALRWKKDVGAGLAFEHDHAGVLLRIAYEDLIKYPVSTLKHVQEHIGVKAIDNLIQRDSQSLEQYSGFYENIHANLDRPPIQANIGKWRDSLRPGQVEVVEAVCGELMEVLGYQRLWVNPQLSSLKVQAARANRSLRMLAQVGRYLRFRRNYLFHLFRRKWRFGLLGEFVRERFL